MKSAAGFQRVKRLGLALSQVSEGTAYGMPALKVGGKVLCSLPANDQPEPETLVVRVSLEQQRELIEADPEVYYLKPHYEGYTCVLVRMGKISDEALEGLLETAYRYVLRKSKC